ncbi:MAG: hypothetical protein NVS3B20_05900 [Polyangiales bacterium]
MCALLGIIASITLSMAAVDNPRTSISTRMVATFGTGLVLTLVAASLREEILPQKILIVLFAGAFAVQVASAVEALPPPSTRGLGILLTLFSITALLRVGAWGLAFKGGIDSRGIVVSQWAAGGAVIAEICAQAFVVLFLVHRPGWRGGIFGIFAVALAFLLATWVLGANPDGSGTLRDALQRALTQRIQVSGLPPIWIAKASMSHEIMLLDYGARLALLPLAYAELASLAVGFAAICSASRADAPFLIALGLAVLSRGQVDTPLRALELSVAALAGLVLARGARIAASPTDVTRSRR